jgi:hypothetical protein
LAAEAAAEPLLGAEFVACAHWQHRDPASRRPPPQASGLSGKVKAVADAGAEAVVTSIHQIANALG